MKASLEEFNNYLHKYYPKSDVTAPYSIGGKVYLRFELGDDLKNGTKKRVQQTVDRATTIFKRAFKNKDDQLWVLYYDYKDSYIKFKDHLSTLCKDSSLDQFEINDLQIHNGYFKTDQNGNSIPELQDTKVGIGLFDQLEFDFIGLIQGIANLEMGFEPKVPQTVMVFDKNSSIGFYMYDDRGCFVWSENSDDIGDLYEDFNIWIVDYDREIMDNYFN